MNKTIILTLLIILLPCIANAQFQASDILLDGTFRAAKYQTKASNSSNSDIEQAFFTINPKLHFFVKDNLSLNIGLGIDFTQWNQILVGSSGLQRVKTTQTIFLITPGARVYYPLSDKISFFNGLNLSAGVGNQKADNNLTADEVDVIKTDANLSHGFSFQITDTFIIQAYSTSLFIERTVEKDVESDLSVTNTQYGIAAFTNLSMSLSFKF